MYTVQANGLSPKCVFMCCPLCSAYEKALEHRAQAIVFLLNVFSNFNLDVQFVKKIFWCSSEVWSILIWKFVDCWLVGIGHVQINSFWMYFWSQIDIDLKVSWLPDHRNRLPFIWMFCGSRSSSFWMLCQSHGWSGPDLLQFICQSEPVGTMTSKLSSNSSNLIQDPICT